MLNLTYRSINNQCVTGLSITPLTDLSMVRSGVTGAVAGGCDLSMHARAITLKSRFVKNKRDSDREKMIQVKRLAFYSIPPLLASSAFVETRNNAIAACDECLQLRSYWTDSKNFCSNHFLRQ